MSGPKNVSPLVHTQTRASDRHLAPKEVPDHSRFWYIGAQVLDSTNDNFVENAIDQIANITALIDAHCDGDTSAYDRAIELLYSELHAIAHRNRVKMGGNPTMQTTAIVNEAYIKLRKGSKGAKSSAHFLSVAAKAMRQIIVDYARVKQAKKRGGDVVHVQLEDASPSVESQAEQVLLIDEALHRLSEHNERLAKVFECKFFTGMDDDELAAALGLTKRTAQREWMKARAFISEYLTVD